MLIGRIIPVYDTFIGQKILCDDQAEFASLHSIVLANVARLVTYAQLLVVR